MAEKKSITVYGLASSENGLIRYIGQTTVSLQTRLKWHITWTIRKRDRSRRTAWITSVLRDGYELTITALEENAVLHETEMRWIAQHQGAELVNGTLGGDGCIGVPKTAEHRAKIGAAHKGRKSPWTAERNRQSAGKPGHPSTPETNAKISAAHKGKPKPGLAERNKAMVWNDEMRAKISAANSGTKASDETKAKLSAVRRNKPWTQARREAFERSKAAK